MRPTLVCDIDGVIADVYTVVERALKEQGIDFSFVNKVHDYNLTGVEAEIRKAIFKEFSNPTTYANALPMYDLESTTEDWESAALYIPSMPKECWLRTTLKAWGEFLNFCSKHSRVVVQTHNYNAECGEARKQWFEQNIKPYAPDVELFIDIGDEKSVLEGDIVIDDCLSNIKKARARYKVMPLMFHNLYNADNSKICSLDEQDFICVSGFYNLTGRILSLLDTFEGVHIQ